MPLVTARVMALYLTLTLSRAHAFMRRGHARLASAGVKLMVEAIGCRSSTPVDVRQPPARALRLSASIFIAIGKRGMPARTCIPFGRSLRVDLP